jgi:hypothetical protein
VRKLVSLCLLGIAVMMFSGLVGSLNSAAKDEKPAVKMNYTKVDIPSQIMERINKEVSRTNPLLITMIKLLPGMNEEELELFKPIVKNAFCRTYLKNPRFTPEGRETVEGWDSVIPVLKEMAAKRKGEDIPITLVDITGKFLAYDLEGRPPLEEDVDLCITIKTHLNLGSDDVMRGDSAHRRLCDLL